MNKLVSIPANIAREAYIFASTEETRYYLCGIRVESAGEGHVYVVATNGHIMGVFLTEGSVAEPTIIRLDKAILAACKTPKRETIDRQLVVEGDQATIYASEKPVAIMPDCVVDGTYPEWRKVLPKKTEVGLACYKAKYLGSFAALGENITVSGGPGAAALVRVSGREDFFGVLMSIREGAENSIPFDVNQE